jgi:formamidopyrimidine-DNA glycosylase
MPELPEVEIITRELSRKIVGKKLSKFSVFDAKKILRPRLGLPQTILAVRRRGKYIVCETGGGLRCLIHLRMTGKLLFHALCSMLRAPESRHERARFYFGDGSILSFVDIRRFGTIDWIKNEDDLPRLGLEPLSAAFSARTLGDIIKKSSRAIKSVLLDQRFVAGIGNIYADEALWLARINPKRKSNSLTPKETARLALSIKSVLREAIKKGGFTLRDYRRMDGSPGHYQNFRKVYNREGLLCFNCRRKIKKGKLSGRSTYFCERCQK